MKITWKSQWGLGPYKNCRIQGPHFYSRMGRWVIDIIWEGGGRKRTLYSRYLMEVSLNRILGPNEIVHHKDHDPLNDTIENLEILTKKEHQQHHLQKYTEDKEYICPSCKKSFLLTPQQQSVRTRNRHRKSSGPFCSKNCAAKSQYIKF